MADSIHVKLPDGSEKEVPKGTTPLEIAKGISPRLADAALVAKTNGNLIDLTKPLSPDKANVLKVLGQSFDYVIDALPRITPEQLQHTWHIPSWKGRNDPDGRAMILNMFVHTAHHRAQCEVYLRAKGIKPPDYTF